VSGDVDGWDLLAGDLDRIEAVDEYRLYDAGEVTRVLVRLKDGRRFMLSAEEQTP